MDIGTGTGVLAIAAALLGTGRVLALDIDPSARTEAAANVAANGLTGKIQITDTPMDRVQGSFSLVLANLRPPTLSSPALSPFSADFVLRSGRSWQNSTASTGGGPVGRSSKMAGRLSSAEKDTDPRRMSRIRQNSRCQPRRAAAGSSRAFNRELNVYSPKGLPTK